jgi:putative effector of murein hydrolase LrgA (UPF0299 family)
LLVLELYQCGIINAMRSLGITIAPLICSLVLLTCALLMSPNSIQRTMSRLLKPAVDMVDSQIACVFIPYIVAVPISPLPTGGALWVSLGVCVVGHLFTMCVAGHLAQLAASYDEASEIERCEIENEELDADELAAKKAEVEAEVKAVPEAPVVFSKASFWSISAIGSAVAGMFTKSGLPNHVALAPAWLCATFAVYLLAKRVPAKLQRVGLFPTLTGGVAMSVLASVAGVLSGGTCADGLRLYMTGCWFLPSVVRSGRRARFSIQSILAEEGALGKLGPARRELGVCCAHGNGLLRGFGKIRRFAERDYTFHGAEVLHDGIGGFDGGLDRRRFEFGGVWVRSRGHDGARHRRVPPGHRWYQEGGRSGCGDRYE